MSIELAHCTLQQVLRYKNLSNKVAATLANRYSLMRDIPYDCRQ